jgi:hypothetical protein
VVGPGETGVHVTEAHAAAVVALVGEVVVAVVLVDDRRALLQRLLDVEHRRQVHVVDPHGGRTRERGGLGLGDDRDDGLTEVAHLVDGEDRLVVRGHADELQRRVQVVRDVGAGDHPHHARHREGGGGVDAGEPGVVAGRPVHLEVQQAVRSDVLEELGAPGDVPERVGPRDHGPDHGEVVLLVLGREVPGVDGTQPVTHETALLRRPAASRIAATIGS